MKFAIFTDPHFVEHASIINTYGNKYSTRLENQLTTFEWVLDTAYANNCDEIICAGDFFDKSTLTDAEITAAKELVWSKNNKNITWNFLVGNHESSANDLSTTSAKLLEDTESAVCRFVHNEPKLVDYGAFELCYLPYITERDRKPITAYFAPKTKPRILISHNDIAGIQMGPVISSIGFSVEELESCADLTINGHLHNGIKVSECVYNLGNVTGKDFGEDCTKYPHNLAIVDTDTMSIAFIENPHALNFYKTDINNEQDLANLTNLCKQKSNLVLSIKCTKAMLPRINQLLDEVRSSVIKTRTIITMEPTSSDSTITSIDTLAVDHLQKLVECVHENLGTSKIIEELLAELVK